jgi:hypothetical protein
MMRSVIPSELASGQLVIVVARWVLVLVGLLIALWHPDPLPELRVEIGVILLVAIANFVMHAQLLRRKPPLEAVAYGTSLGDLLVISLLVTAQGGFAATTFVFFFPAVLAIAVAFPTARAAALSAIAVFLALIVGAPGAPGAEPLLLRGLALAAVAVIGNSYWRLHRDRMHPSLTPRREAAADLFWGQVATFWARWAIVLGGALLVLSRARTTADLALGILPVVALLVVNFYLHGRYLVERPANTALTLLASCFDLAMLALLFSGWSGAPGVGNPYYVLLYPMVFSVTLVFPPRLSAPYTLAALGLFALLVLPASVGSESDLKTLLVRVVTLAATGGLGTLYWRTVRRRRSPMEAYDEQTAAALAWNPARAG